MCQLDTFISSEFGKFGHFCLQLLWHEKLALKKRFGRALTQLFIRNLGKLGHSSPFVTVARFEASTIRIMGQAIYLCDTVAQEISIEKKIWVCLDTIISPNFWEIWSFLAFRNSGKI